MAGTTASPLDSEPAPVVTRPDDDLAETSEEEDCCELCYESPRELRFRPCGHAITCELCTLKLIGHSMNKILKCPNCATEIERFRLFSFGDAGGEGSTTGGLVRHPTFQRLDDEDAPVGCTVEDFIGLHMESANENRRAAAAAAKKAWKPGLPTVLPDRALRLPVPNGPVARSLALVGSAALVCVWLWGVLATMAASSEFAALLGSHDFEVRVAALEGLEGPVNVLLQVNQTCPALGPNGMLLFNESVPCAEALPEPSAHQRWWGLVPASQIGLTTTVAGVERARSLVGVLVVFVGSSTVLKTLVSALGNQPRALGELSSAGFNSMVNMALLCSLYGTYWDEQRLIVAVNYFPGYAYVWLVLWVPLWILFVGIAQSLHGRPGLAAARLHRIMILVCVATFVYWLFWLLIPLLGYSWFFAWKFVDAISAPRPSGAPPPFSAASATNLGPPFESTVWVSFVCWITGTVASIAKVTHHYYLLRVDPEYRQARFLAANTRDSARNTNAATQTAGTQTVASGSAAELV